MKILITGSHGRIGKILVEFLEKKYDLVSLDKKNSENPVDILKDSITEYFSDVGTVIHLAANANPFIGERNALKNVEIVKNVIEECKKVGTIKRIINASSINVYPYIDMFGSGEKLTEKTPLSPNMRFGNGKYGRAKIEVERLFEEYCKSHNIFLINLRLGCVTENDLPPTETEGGLGEIENEIHLKHDELIKVIKQALECKGIRSYICVSKKDGFVNKSINFLL